IRPNASASPAWARSTSAHTSAAASPGSGRAPYLGGSVLGGSLSVGGPEVLCAGTTTVRSADGLSGRLLRCPAVGCAGIAGRPGAVTRPPPARPLLGRGLALPPGGMRTPGDSL